jgi:hypothetical protein
VHDPLTNLVSRFRAAPRIAHQLRGPAPPAVRPTATKLRRQTATRHDRSDAGSRQAGWLDKRGELSISHETIYATSGGTVPTEATSKRYDYDTPEERFHVA